MLPIRLALATGALLCVLAAAAVAQDTVIARPSAPAREDSAQPIPGAMFRAGSIEIDLRRLPLTPPVKRERPEFKDPDIERIELPGAPAVNAPTRIPGPSAPAPAPIASFNGLDFAAWGAGHPPDTNGDVGPTYYIQSINASVGIYSKTGGPPVAAFTFNTLMSQGSFGNLCDTNNFGDPVVLYDSFEDRWVLTDFAFTLDISNNINAPSFQCFAVSKTGDPVAGGWYFYSLQLTDGLNDYAKFGIWPDGIYMSANMFSFDAGSAYQGPRVWAFNKAQMYAGSPTIQIVSFNPPAADFTLMPSNARLQTGTPPLGRPNLFVSTWQFLNSLTVYKFHVDWDKISLSTFTGPDVPLASTSWPNAGVPNAPSLGGNSLDVLPIRAMMQNQYSSISGVESLWVPHTVRRANTSGFAAPRWYQVDVTGGSVAANLPQATTWDPDGANVIHRFMPSLAVNRNGDLALGYSTSSSTTKPAIMYAGRLSGDPANTFSQTEQILIQGTGTQTGSCGGTCARWGDYSAMSLDPDGCTFWYTNEYYAVDGLNHQTRIGSFAYPSCTPVGAGGTLAGTVTATVGGAPISGAKVTLGSRTTTTNGSGAYTFTGIPAGTYPGEAASAAGYNPTSASNLVITDAATTTQNFALATALLNACSVDTTLTDFQRGVGTGVDLTTSAGDVTLSNAPTIDQSNTAGTTTGTSFGTASWGGQTFIPAVSGQLTQVDVQLFCSGCTGTTPTLTLSVRATSGGLPTGADLATVTIPGFSSNAAVYYTASFGSPPTLTSGTQYALVLRPTSAPTVGGYVWIRASPSSYANGQRVVSTDNGVTFTGDVTRDFNFKTYMQVGFTSGNLTSSLKDSNPAAGYTPTWPSLSWTTVNPANTSLKFQIAASNSATGPFTFVGPDSTAATFFTTSGATLAQFNGNRYLKYKALLSTTDTAVTPAVNDVTVCFQNNAVAVNADLAITNTDGVATATAGGSVTYTITASNAGPSTATGATVADTFPAALTCTWTCVGAGGGTCTASGAGNFADTVNLPVGGNVTYTATCSIAPGATGSLSNTATVSAPAGVTDPNPGNNSATDTDTLGASADLFVTKTDSPDPVIAGNNLTYTITVANAGPSNAAAASLADSLPAGTTFVSLASAGGWSCTTPAVGASGNISCTNASFAPGNAVFTLVVKVGASVAAATVLSNTATVATTTTDPNAANNSATATTTVAASADLSVTKTDSPDPVIAGNNLTYTITVANAGPSNAAAASLADSLPAGTTFVSLASAGGWSCTTPAVGASGNISCTNASFAPGNAVFTLVVKVGASVAAATVLSNTATVATTTTDPNAANNSATATTTVGASADLSLTLTNAPNPVLAGNNLTYTLTAGNAGPSSAPTASLTDTLPAGTTFVSLNSPAGWSCSTPAVGATGTITCTHPTLAVSSGIPFILVVKVGAATPNGTILTNSAAIVSGAADPVAGNSTASTTTTVTNGATVSGTKTVAGAFLPGGTVTYTVILSNSSGSPQADNAGDEFSDVLPASLTLVSATASAGSALATVATNTVTWNGSIPAAGNVTITITANIKAGTALGTIVSNQGTIKFDADGNGSNESTAATDDPAVAGANDPTVFTVNATNVSGTKVASGGFYPGYNIVYTVVLTNSGNVPAPDNPGNEFSDLLPSTLTLVSVTASSGTALATVATNTVSWNGVIPAGGSVTITINATIKATTSPQTVISNQGTIAFASGGGATNDGTTTTDDPALAGAHDPTVFTVRGALDVDSSGASTRYDALTDGLILIRYMFSLSGPSLTSEAIGPTAARTDPAAIKAYLDAMGLQLDVDGDGNVQALSDGLLILRYLFGLRGAALIDGAVAFGATRTTAAQIEAYIQSLLP